MKNFVLIFALLLAAVVGAQSKDQEQILKDSKSFVQKFKEKNYDHILDMTYPGLLELMDRELLKSTFVKMLDGNDEFKMNMLSDAGDKFDVSEVRTSKNGARYAFVTYPSKLSMHFLKQDLDKDMQEMVVNGMKASGMDAKFTDARTVVASKKGMMVAISDAKSHNTWKYLNHDEGNALYKQLLEAEILDAATAYYEKN